MFETFIHLTTRVIEAIGVLVIILGGLWAALLSLKVKEAKYNFFRRRLGLSILLGLEFLVAADIINTVAVQPTLKNVSILGLIVLIRTFLSFSLEVEIQGNLPWKSKESGLK